MPLLAPMGAGQLTFMNLDYGDPGWVRKMESPGPFDAIVSGYSIHHQPDQRKPSLYEELFHDQECLTETRHEKILLAQSRHVEWDHIRSIMEEMEVACRNYDEPLCRLLLQRLVPEMGQHELPVDNVVKLIRAKV